MNSAIPTPQSFGLSHSDWRENQIDAFKIVRDKYGSGGGISVVELGTGSGKSGFATMLSTLDNVCVLVQNLGLLTQYEREYGFDVIRGRQEYECAHQQKREMWQNYYGKVPTARDCHLRNMFECGYARECSYFRAREKALSSNRMACTYKYASLSPSISKREGIIVMDEAHNMAEELISVSEVRITDSIIEKHELDDFPFKSYGSGGKGDLLTDADKGDVILWLSNCLSKVDKQSGQLNFEFMTQKDADASKIVAFFNQAIEIVLAHNEVFLVIEEKSQSRFYKTKQLVITLKPLTPRLLAKKLLANKYASVLMSATIGNPKPLTGELGISNYIFDTFPHPVPPSARPIYDLKMGRMTHKEVTKNPNLPRIQGKVIGNFINKLDPSWRGIVLATSNYKVKALREMLTDKFNGRVFTPSDGLSLNERINSFIEDQREGLIAVDTIQGWGTGIDLRGDLARYAIVAGVPYPNPMDRYTKLRLARKGGFNYGMWNAYSAVCQAVGRCSRGEIESDGDFMLNVGAVADGSALISRAMSYYPKFFKEAIIR